MVIPECYSLPIQAGGFRWTSAAQGYTVALKGYNSDDLETTANAQKAAENPLGRRRSSRRLDPVFVTLSAATAAPTESK